MAVETEAVRGTVEDWARARVLVDDLAAVRAKEQELSAEFDTLMATLTRAGNTGHVIAKELGIARTTVSRSTRRAGG
jgi:uncharacterized protein YerC